MVNLQVASATYFKFIIMASALDWISTGFNAAQGVVNAVNSYQNNKFQREENQKNRDFQSIEAEKQRMYNSSEAAIARNFSAEQADKAYQRSTLGSQISQMKAAGLNPAMMYSQGQFAPAAAAPTSQASSSASPSGSGGFSPVAAPDINMARQIAEIDNIKANTRKVENEADEAGVNAKYAEQFAQQRLQLNNVEIELGKWAAKASEQDIKESEALTKKLDEESKNLVSQRDLLVSQKHSIDQDVWQKRIDNFFRSDYWRAQLAQMAAITRKTTQEVDIAWKRLEMDIRKCNSDIEVNEKLKLFYHNMGFKAGVEGNSIKLHDEEYRDYREWAKGTNGVATFLTNTSNLIGAVLGGAVPLLKGF